VAVLIGNPAVALCIDTRFSGDVSLNALQQKLKKLSFLLFLLVDGFFNSIE